MHPIFQKCSELETDDYWRSFYKDLSNGRSPPNLYVSANAVSIKNKTSVSFTLVGKSANEITKSLKAFLLKHTTIGSRKDKQKQKKLVDEDAKQINENNLVTSWTLIKKKNVKELMLLEFALKLKSDHNLSIKQANKAYDFIRNLLTIAPIPSKHIILENGKIVKIQNLDYDNVSNMFTHPLANALDNQDKSFSTKNQNSAIMLRDMWEKHLMGIFKSSIFVEN